MKNSEKVAKIIDANVHRITELVIEQETAEKAILTLEGPNGEGVTVSDQEEIIERVLFGIDLLRAVNKDLMAFHKTLVEEGQ